MATGRGVTRRKLLSSANEVLKTARREYSQTAHQICIKSIQCGLRVRQRDAFSRVGRISPDLEAHRLAELERQQRGDLQWFFHRCRVRRRRLRICLLDV